MTIELPCNVNDKVYCIENDEIVVREVICFLVGQNGVTACLVNRRASEKTFDADIEWFGKTVFLSKTDAQEALHGQLLMF